MLFMELNIDAIRYGVMHPEFQRQTNYVISRAINMTLYDIRDKQVTKRPFGRISIKGPKINDDGSVTEERVRRIQNYKPGSGEIDKYIKGSATSWTKRGMFIRGSNKSSLVGYLGFKDRDYMKWMVYGGTALPNKKKIQVPVFNKGKSVIPLNKFGGIKNPLNAVNNRKEKKGRYFLGHPNNWPETPNNYGLWEILGAKTKKRRRIRKVVAFDANRTQAAQYPLPQLGMDYANKIFGINLDRALRHALSHRDFRAPAGRTFGGGY